MHILDNKTEEFIKLKLTTELEEIQVIAGKCRYNFRCQMNAVHEASRNNHSKLAIAVYVNQHDQLIVHFIMWHTCTYKK